MAKKYRTIHYFRVSWTSGSPVSLGRMLVHCLNALPTRGNTLLPVRNGQAAVMHRDVHDTEDVDLHVVSWIPGDQTSTVPHTRPDLEVVNPPQNSDFLRGDAMLLIRGNHFLVLTSGMRLSPVEFYLKELLKECDEDATQFELVPIANRGLLQQIRSEGIKRITLGLSQYLETFNADEPRTFKSQIGLRFRNLLMDTSSWESISRANLQASLSVVSGTVSDGGLSSDEMADLADEIALDEDDALFEDVVIETKKGTTHARNELKLRRKAGVETHGTTVSYVAAWQEMENYFLELEENGALEY